MRQTVKIAFVFALLAFSALAPLQRTFAGEGEEVAYQKGIFAFSDDAFKEALGHFQFAHKGDPKNIDYAYFLGETYLRLKDYENASKTFETLLKHNPKFTRAYYDYALSLYLQNRSQEARSWFQKAVSQGDLDPGLEKTAKDWIARIDAGKGAPILRRAKGPKKVKRLNLAASTGFFFDSNVISDPDEEEVAGFGTDKDELMATASLLVNWLIVNSPKWQFFVDASGYQTAYANIYFDADSFNSGNHKIGPRVHFRPSKSLRFRFPMIYSFSTLGNSRHVQSAYIDGAVDFSWKKNYLTIFTGTFRVDDYYSTPANRGQARDAYRAHFRLDNYYFFPNRKRYLRGGYEFVINWAKGNDWDYDTHRMILALNTPIFWDINYLTMYSFDLRKQHYNLDSVYNLFRQDFSVTMTHVLTKQFSDHFKAAISWTFSRTDSNISNFTNKRHVAGFTLSVMI